jgi:hypothetical protein
VKPTDSLSDMAAEKSRVMTVFIQLRPKSVPRDWIVDAVMDEELANNGYRRLGVPGAAGSISKGEGSSE